LTLTEAESISTMRNLNTNVVLEARKFSCHIGGKAILRDVSLQIRRGEYISIVGPNGAGKTTLLRAFDRMMTGSVSGELDICAISWRDWKQADLAKLAAFIPQADSRAMPFTVEDFLLMCRYPYTSPFATVRASDRKVIREAMVGTGTTDFAQRRLDTLSSGERQKVYVAAALAQGAHIWLLDEPTTFLDYHHQAEILSLVALANKEFDVTVVAVTHDLNHAALESDRIIALREGEVAFYGTPNLMMKPDVLQRIYGSPFLLVDHPTSGMPMIVPHRTPEQEKELAKWRAKADEKMK
jgi:ABC-type cobalamin/Fe3+-siderophores transport system ATPase subunit